MKIGMYPGTFDPVTVGHLDIIKRSEKLVDKLIVAIAEHPGPTEPLFSIADRVKLVQDDVAALGLKIEIEVTGFDDLLIHYAEQRNVSMILRGLRAVSDFDYEFQMTGMNYQLNPDIQTVFLMSQDRYQFISSRFVKEICRLGGNIEKFVTPGVKEALHKKFTK
jgi:pantetheine-phosphate adenylyltransferase